MLYPFPILVGHKKKGRKQGQKMERVFNENWFLSEVFGLIFCRKLARLVIIEKTRCPKIVRKIFNDLIFLM
jgi:hypothetical protein